MGRHKLRSFFMMLGIVVGITALTLLVAVGLGAERKVMKSVDKMFGPDEMFIVAGGGQRRGAANQGPVTTLKLDDLEVLYKSINNVVNFDPMLMTPPKEVVYRSSASDFRIMGHSSRAEEVWNRGVTTGRFFNDADMSQKSRVALIGEHAAQELFKGEDPVDKQIRIGNAPYRIIGVLDKAGIDPHGNDKDNEIHIPVTTMMSRMLNIDYIMMAKLKLEKPELQQETIDQVTAMLRTRHSLADGEPDDFRTFTPTLVQELIAEANRMFTLFLPLIASVSLLISGIIIANLMIISVNERVSEIGIRKAVGATRSDILTQFILETVVVSLTGSLTGIILGVFGVRIVSNMMEQPFVLPWFMMIISVLSSVVIGFIAGIIPARRAAKMDPVTALQ